MYYLFLKNEKKLDDYKMKLLKVYENLEKGKTPVYNEISAAKNDLFQCLPYNLISGSFLVFSGFLLSFLDCSEILKVAVVMIINSFCHQFANIIFTFVKHNLRLRLCERLGIGPTERIIAAMESLEYQSV